MANWGEMRTSRTVAISSQLWPSHVVLAVQAATAFIAAVLLISTDVDVRPPWFDQHRTLGALVAFLLGAALLVLRFQLGRQRSTAWLATVVLQSIFVGGALGAMVDRWSFNVDLGLVLALVALATLLRATTRDRFLSR